MFLKMLLLKVWHNMIVPLFWGIIGLITYLAILAGVLWAGWKLVGPGPISEGAVMQLILLAVAITTPIWNALWAPLPMTYVKTRKGSRLLGQDEKGDE